MSKIERVFYINKKILEEGKVTTQQVAEKYEISTRQVMRDFDYLRDNLKAPIAYDHNQKGYIYTEHFSLLSNTNERMLVLNAIFRSLAESQGVMSVVTEMITQGIDSGVDQDYKALTDKIVFITPIQDWPDYSIFNKVCSAMKSSERMTMHYHNGQGEATVRHIEPLRLVNYSGRWYLLAFDLKHRELRIFHLSRIEDINAIVGDFFHSSFTEDQLNTFIHGGYGIFMGSESINVTFRIFGSAVHTVATQTWHKEQKVKHLQVEGKEVLEVTLPVANMQEILSKVLSFGSAARPVSPPSFVDAWKATVLKMQSLAEEL
ncbi:putative transcriptional regulator [Sphaerochaeta pleomorpha str. Grapes]|uniref:Putative transcriptional regulator n=1 Tax=Sphaerochaeta pleomorpha (strain ATCC BAA-1885 / DSM 22778 / Grapes) TaxID=158190 RepID=G8QSG8_SPHPG|nr:WYL domain-containing protein [Sphaerochaeta pleomorpha]AEV30098.1 putative transcriptional regulator [Sphaerochaeta pleomorpha str. Grapes]